MAIQIPDAGTGNGATGDNEYILWQKTINNFSDQTHAASRLVGTEVGQVPLAEQVYKLFGTAATKNVGTATGNVMEVGAFGLGSKTVLLTTNSTAVEQIAQLSLKGSQFYRSESVNPLAHRYSASTFVRSENTYSGISVGYEGEGVRCFGGIDGRNAIVYDLWTNLNATKDPNGFLKGASPIAEIYSDKMDLNHDATQQGGITFEKLGTGDYLVKGSLGFAQEGWYIETPKDANGNVLVAVVYKQLENNDLSIKTYAKRFDDETGDIVANLAKPRDIPTGRFISLRLHELPKEPLVNPNNIQTEEIVVLDK